MRKNTKPHICAYCGSSDSLTKDHVPPKNLFPKPRPHNLVKVLACNNCHSQTSKDDEYFRLKILMRNGISSNLAARVVWNTVLRSLSKSEAIGFRRKTLSDFRVINIKTPSGLYVDRKLGYNVNMNRIRSVVQRIVRGLYFVESENPLGLNNEVRVYMDEDIKQQPSDVIKKLQQTILQPLAALSPRIIGNNVFLYRYKIMKENPLLSVWGMSFYEHIPFLAITTPINY
jgi:hypothetical protein